MSREGGGGIKGISYEISRITDLINLQLKKPEATSFHEDHGHSCYIHISGLHRDLEEQDIATIFSQWGEVVDIDLVRDRRTKEFRGFGFLAYEDQRSTILAVDNGNGMELNGRRVKVDHAANYHADEQRMKAKGVNDWRGTGGEQRAGVKTDRDRWDPLPNPEIKTEDEKKAN